MPLHELRQQVADIPQVESEVLMTQFQLAQLQAQAPIAADPAAMQAYMLARGRAGAAAQQGAEGTPAL